MAKPKLVKLWMGYGGPDTDNLPLRSTIIDRTVLFFSKGRGWQNQEAEYRAAGYTGLITIYQLFLQIQRQVHSQLNWNHNQWVTSQADFNALPSTAFLRKGSASGSRIEYSPGDYGSDFPIYFVWIDPKDPAVRTWMRDRIQNLLSRYGANADGVFFDNISWGLKQVKDDAGGVGVYSNYTGELYTETTWAQANADLCNWLKANIVHPLGKPVILGGNLIHQNSSTDWTKYFGLDYIMDESMDGYPQIASEYSATRIKHTINQAKNFMNLSPNKFVAFTAQSNDEGGAPASFADDLREMRMTVGQYCMTVPNDNELVINGRSIGKLSYRFTNYHRYGQWWDYPDVFDKDLGLPVGSSFEEQPGLWRRNYTKGYVRVNFNTSSVGGLAARDAEFIITGSGGGGGGTTPPSTTPSISIFGPSATGDTVSYLDITTSASTVANQPVYFHLSVRNTGSESGRAVDVTPPNPTDWVLAANGTAKIHDDYDSTMWVFRYTPTIAGAQTYRFNLELATDVAGRAFQPSNVDHNSIAFVGQVNPTATTSAATGIANLGANTLAMYLSTVIGINASLDYVTNNTGLTALYSDKASGVGVSSFAAYLITSPIGMSSSVSFNPTISYAAKSQTAILTFKGAGQKPKKPFIKMALKRNQKAIIVWSGTADTSSYNLKRSTSPTGPFATVHSEVAAPNDEGVSIEWTDTGLTNNVTYYYGVTSVNAVGETDLSDIASVTPDIDIPTNVHATVQGLLAIQVDVESVEGAVGYIFQKALQEAGPWDSSPQQNINSYTWMNLTTNTRYYFRAYAVASGGDTSDMSQAVSITTASGKSWYAGDAVFNTGRYDAASERGTGFIDLYSTGSIKFDNQAGPTMVMNVRSGTEYNSWVEHSAIGNLSGLYGYTTDVYGVAVGRYSPTTSWLSVDPDNGVRIMNGDTQLASWNSEGEIGLGIDEHTKITDNGINFTGHHIDGDPDITLDHGIGWLNSTETSVISRLYVEGEEPAYETYLWGYSSPVYIRSGNHTSLSVSDGKVRVSGGNFELSSGSSATFGGTASFSSTVFLEGPIDHSFSSDGRVIIGQTGTSSRRFDFFYAEAPSSSQNMLFYGGDSGNGFKMNNFAVQATTIDLLGTVTITPPTVQSVTYQNGWVDFGGTYAAAGYWKDAYGVVRFRGRIKTTTGALGTTAFTLPVGYRPSTTKIFPVIAGTSSSIGSIIVNTDGTVVMNTGSINAMSLDGVTYRL